MATLTVQKADFDGLNATYDPADVAGDQFAWGSNIALIVKNDDASSHTVTITSQRAATQGYTTADTTVTVPAGEERIIGGLLRDAFRDSDGFVQVSYDAVTSVTVAAISV